MRRLLPFPKGTHFAHHGHPCVFQGYAANGRCQFVDGEGWMLEVPDPETGFPVWPFPEDVHALMADMRLVKRADPLECPVRQRARAAEGTRIELADAKCKSAPDRSRDPWYYLRQETLTAWDDPDIERCALTKKGIEQWYDDNFVVAELKRRFGRLPSDTTFRKWVRTRGTDGDRRPPDYSSWSGVGERRRRIDAVVLAIIKLWALRFHTKPRQSRSAWWRRAGEDVQRYARGEALEILDFERALDPPARPEDVKMCARRIFCQEIERAAGGSAAAEAWNQQARRQRFGGGGVAQEPVRFLQYVQLDATPFPMVFVFDAIRRLPVGVPTVTIALDVFTRVIVGWDVTYDPPSYATFMRTMLHTALPKRVPASFECAPGIASALAELSGKIVGHLLVDNAREQIGRAAQDAGGDIGHGVRWAGVNQPTHKPHVESCLGTLQDMLCDELPGATWDIPLMRRYGYDPTKHAIVTLEQFREKLAIAIAKYHTTGHSSLLDRTPVDVWQEQREIHGLAWVSDPDHFRRAVGELAHVTFRGDGFSIEGLRYGCDGSDERFPVSNEDLLFHLGLARGVAANAVKRSFDHVKVKYDPSDLSIAWLFDEHLGRYVELPCTMRRYAENLPLWLHERLKAYAKEKRLAFADEHDMIAVREAYAREMARIVPEATAAERRAAARLANTTEGRTYLGDAVRILKIEPSPTGMETIIPQADRVGTRGDPNRVAPRSSGRTGSRRGGRARRDAPIDQSTVDREEAIRVGRRLDVDLGIDGYI